MDFAIRARLVFSMGSGGGALARKLKDLQLATKGEQVTRKKDALGFKAVERTKSPAKKSTMKLNGVYGTQPARRRRGNENFTKQLDQLRKEQIQHSERLKYWK